MAQSRAELEKKLNESFAAIRKDLQPRQDFATRKEEVLATMQPPLETQQKNPYLQSVQDCHEFYKNTKGFFEARAEEEVERGAEIDESLHTMKMNYMLLEDKLNSWRDDPDDVHEEAIQQMRLMFTQNPRMARALFSDDYSESLMKRFEEIFEKTELKVTRLESEVFATRFKVVEELKDFIFRGEFHERLEKAIGVLEDAHTEAVAANEELERDNVHKSAELQEKSDELQQHEQVKVELLNKIQTAATESERSRAATTKETQAKDIAIAEVKRLEGVAAGAESSKRAAEEQTRLKDALLAEANQAKEEAAEKARQLEYDNQQTLSNIKREHLTAIESKGQAIANLNQAKEDATEKARQLENDHQVTVSDLKQQHLTAIESKDEAITHTKERAAEEARQLENDYQKTVSDLKQQHLTEIASKGEAIANLTRQLEEAIALHTQQQKEAKSEIQGLQNQRTKANDQAGELEDQLALFLTNNVIKSATMATHPELTTIIERGFSMMKGEVNLDQANVLDSTNSLLAQGTQLVADTTPGVFILIERDTIFIFDFQDVPHLLCEDLIIFLVFDCYGVAEERKLGKSFATQSWVTRFMGAAKFEMRGG